MIKKTYAAALGYWILVGLVILIIIFSGSLDFESWVVNFNFATPLPISVPFTLFVISLIALGVILTLAAWAGYKLVSTPFGE